MFKNKEEQFDFYWKEIFDGLAYNPIEFNTYRFDQTMSLPSKFNKLYELFKQLALNNQEVMDYLKEFMETFDFKIETTVKDVLIVWLNEGLLAEIVRDSINEEVVASREDIEGETFPHLNERLDKWENKTVDLFEIIAESLKDIENTEHQNIHSRLSKWEKRTVQVENDIKSHHLNIDWYVPNDTDNYTEIFDELIIASTNLQIPIYLPEFKTYQCDRSYPPNLFYGNGRLFDKKENKEIQISKSPDNIYQYSQGEIKHKNLYGTYNNAVMQSLMANDINQVPQILGIRPENAEILSTYNNRDNAVQFLSISSHSNFLEFEASEVTYTSDGVIIPSLTKEMDIPVGSILDTRHSPFYSALVKSVDYVTKKITVYKGWYKTDGSKVVTTPPNNKGLTINRTTAVWVANWLIYLNADDENTACTMLEAGIINEQPKVENVTGIDMLLMGKYGGNNAFQSRGRHGKWLVGFSDEGSDTSFKSENATNGARIINPRDIAYYSYEAPVALRTIGKKDGLTLYTTVDGSPFRINNRGIQNKIGFEYEVISENKEINLQLAIHIVTNGVTKLTLPRGDNYVGLMIEIFSLSDSSFGIEGYLHYNGSTATGYNVSRKGESIRLFCDGSVWYKMGD